MNVYLEKLFKKHKLSEKNIYEIRQIYSLLPTKKQKNLINNFERLVESIQIIEGQINTEREILIGDALTNVRNVIIKVRKEKSLKQTKGEIDFLKQKIK